MTLVRGFKTEAERIAVQVRSDVGVPAWAPLSPWTLADHLGIPLDPLTALDAPGAVARFTGDHTGEFSALTVFHGSKRLVVYNDGHSPARQASDISHELAHGLLLHEPRPALDALGCRNWDDDIEDEATWLGGALLVPKPAAYGIVKKGWSDADAARRYHCSEQMIRWRLGITGARRVRDRAAG